MKKGISCILLAASFAFFVSDAISKEASKMNGLRISSPVFENNSHIPVKYSCDGMNINPPLLIENVPANTKSVALIVDDPDAVIGTFVHWVLWNIDPGTREIKENSVPEGAKQGLNDARKHNYVGPCPPSGTHRYFFKLYALDAVLTPGPDSIKADIEKAMERHIIDQTHITGLYKRR